MTTCRLIEGDALTVLQTLPAESVQCVVTSPPYYGLRDYGVAGQIGLEGTPDAFVARLVAIFREVLRVLRVLRPDGVIWLNIGDSYASTGGAVTSGAMGASSQRQGRKSTAVQTLRVLPSAGLKPKDLIGIPWMLAFALRNDGWYLRQDIIWAKPNPMPESVEDRCTRAHEYLFLLSKSARYYYDADALREPHSRDWAGENVGPAYMTAQQGRNDGGKRQGNFQNPLGHNKRSVWSIATDPYPGAHFAVMPEALVQPCVLAGSRPGDTVLDPFVGSGTASVVALSHGRNFIGVDLNPAYLELARQRLGLFASEVSA